MKHFTGISLFMAFALLAAGFCPAWGGVLLVPNTPKTKEEIRAEREARKKEQDLLKRLTQYGEMASKGCPLYESVKAELESYYGRTDFSDPGRKNGWYRVGLFLKWLASQEEELKRDKISYRDSANKISVCEVLRKNDNKNISSEDKRNVLSVWLGAKYIADIYARPYGIKRMPVFDWGELGDTDSATIKNSGKGKEPTATISFSRDEHSFVEGLNSGIHEGTHLLDWIRGGNEALNEFATFSTTFLFALPLKPGGKTAFLFALSGKSGWETTRYRGIRSLNGFLGEEVPCGDFLREYASFLLGALSYQELKQSNIFALKRSSFKREGTSFDLLRALAAYKKGKLYLADTLSPRIVADGDWDAAQSVFSMKAPDCEAFLANVDLPKHASGKPVKVPCGKTALWVQQKGENHWEGIKGDLVSFSQLVEAFAPSSELRGAAARELRNILNGMAQDLDAIPTEQAEFLYGFSLSVSSPEGEAACRAFQRYLRGVSTGRVPPVPQGYW